MTTPSLTVARHKGHGDLSGQHDIAVVIDVIRAFTFAKTAFDGGVSRILLAETVEDAHTLAGQHSGAFLAGEIDALPIDGFDFGNSPSQIAGRDFTDQTIIHRTSNGTKMAIAALKHASTVMVTGLSNAHATAERIGQLASDRAQSLLLVATHPTGDEDVACGDFFLSLLGQPGGISDDAAFDRTRLSDAAAKFLDPMQPAFPATDMVHVLAMDPPAYVMQVTLEDDVATVRKVLL